jgi:1,4-dihydroxy-2-naphthoyl-CoA hydrolase
MTESVDLARDSMPMCDTLDVSTARAEPALVVLELGWAPHLCTSAGILHGGTIMALADSAAGLCAFLNLPAGSAGTATIESKTNFFGAVRDGTVVASARPLHTGSTTIVIETEVRAGDRLVAKTTQTQAVKRPEAVC